MSRPKAFSVIRVPDNYKRYSDSMKRLEVWAILWLRVTEDEYIAQSVCSRHAVTSGVNDVMQRGTELQQVS